MQVINLIFMVSALRFMVNNPDYVAWPSKLSPGANWWVLGDNWETTVIFTTVSLQFVTSAFVFSYGWHYRRPVWYNWMLILTAAFFYAFISGLLLGPSTDVSKWFHIASEDFNRNNTDSVIWATYQTQKQTECLDALCTASPDPNCATLAVNVARCAASSPAMSTSFRARLWVLILFGNFCAMIWEAVAIQGVVYRALRKRYGAGDGVVPIPII